MKELLIIFAVAAGVTAATTPLMVMLAKRLNILAIPSSDRHVHTKPTPLLGGASMFLGLLAAILVASRMDHFASIFNGSSEPLGLLAGAGAMFAVGLVDDVKGVSPPAKLAGQVLAGSLMAVFGLTMYYFRVPFASDNFLVLPTDIAPIVTVLWVVLMANAINLIDGLDGLASGIVAIAGMGLFLYSDRLLRNNLLEPSNISQLVAVIMVGMCLGFLPFNFTPARLFMGDAGAMLLGVMMATTSVTMGGRVADEFAGQTYFFFAPLFIPLVVLGVPLLDTVLSFTRRLIRGKSFATADREHLHHRLMRLGHGPRRSVVILWAFTALLSAMALFPTYTNTGGALVPIGIGAAALGLYIWFHPGRKDADIKVAGFDFPEDADNVVAFPVRTPGGTRRERRQNGRE
ncbi:MAG: MraY family glycosyltransferase [Acidimicrobiia bacterium]